MLHQKVTNFPKIWEPSQTVGRQNGGRKHIPYWGSTNNRHPHTKSSSPGDLALGFVHLWVTLFCIKSEVTNNKRYEVVSDYAVKLRRSGGSFPLCPAFLKQDFYAVSIRWFSESTSSYVYFIFAEHRWERNLPVRILLLLEKAAAARIYFCISFWTPLSERRILFWALL
jgi:hypothetical protein